MAITNPLLVVIYHVPAYTMYRLVIYASFVVSVWLGPRLTGTQNPLKIAAFSLPNSFQFFVITNFGNLAMVPDLSQNHSGASDVLRGSGPVFRLDPCR